MAKRKVNRSYFFSVEGETEQWYLEWLKNCINSSDNVSCNVSFDCKVQKDPVKRVKSLTALGKTNIWHLSDYESDEECHIRQFHETMDRMRMAQHLGKEITYHFGYSNLTFDLWMILHRSDCFSTFTDRRRYVIPINRAYGEHFENMEQFKHEENFKRCLRILNLQSVKDAIERSKKIMAMREKNGDLLCEYKGVHFYKTNPSLAIWKIMETILKDCGILS